MKLHKEVLSKTGFNILKNLQSTKELEDFYLVGGTALALQIGHRKSNDFDLFSQSEFKSNIVSNISFKYKVISLHNNSIELEIKGNKLFFFYFAFPLFKKTKTAEGLKLAHPIDIGLMKLLSLQGRNAKKDIIDLYFIDKEVIKLEKLLELFNAHYPKEGFNGYDSLKNLIDISALEKQPTPKMLKKCNWKECFKTVKSKIKKHVQRSIFTG